MGFDCGIAVEPLQRHHFTATPEGKLVSVDEELLSASCVVIQRPTIYLHLQLLRALQQAGVAVVVELDDLLHKLPKYHGMRAQLTQVHLATLEKCCREADLLTVSTQPLADFYGRNTPTRVIPNFIPSHYLDVATPEDHDVVGWFGSLGTHPDIHATDVGKAVEANAWRFRVLGRPELIDRAFGLSAPPETVPWQGLDEYYREVSKFAIGVAPLGNNPFSRSKSDLKLKEYAALGVPCIASDVLPYRQLHERYGIGLIADRDWSQVDALIKDPARRREMSFHGREVVREHLTIEGNAHLWAEAWSDAIKYRHNQKAAA